MRHGPTAEGQSRLLLQVLRSLLLLLVRPDLLTNALLAAIHLGKRLRLAHEGHLAGPARDVRSSALSARTQTPQETLAVQ